MYIFVPKSERIGFGSDLHTSTNCMYQGPDVQIGDHFQTNIIAELIIENSFHNLSIISKAKAPFDFLQVSTEELVIFIEIFHVPNFNDVLNEFLLVFGKIIFSHCKYGLCL